MDAPLARGCTATSYRSVFGCAVCNEMAGVYAHADHDRSMLPLGHLSLAYLCYVGAAAVSRHRLPARWGLVWVAVGSQFPDLVDKPLAYVGVVTYGRSLAHSLFTLLFISGLVWVGTRRLAAAWSATRLPDQLRRTLPAAFSIGYASHLLGDAHEALLAGNLWEARFILYPLYQLPASPADEVAPWIRLLDIYQQMETHPHIGLILVTLTVFVGVRVRTHWATRRAEQS